MTTNRRTNQPLIWLTPCRYQGQIVAAHQPQVVGAAEGTEGRAAGLRLETDSSDMSWRVWRRGSVIASGSYRGDSRVPSVEEALAMA